MWFFWKVVQYTKCKKVHINDVMCTLANLRDWKAFVKQCVNTVLLDDDNFNVRRILETDKQDD